MDFFKAQLARIQTQIDGLTASQKMLTISLVTIMVMTMFWWSRWAAEPDMTAVLNQSLNADEIGQITTILDTKEIPHKVVGDKVMVPTDRKMEVLAELGFSQALPRNFGSAFDDMIKEGNWFDSADRSDRMFLEAKQRTLAMVIGNFPGVAAAVVLIDPTNERRFDDTAVQPSASVMITTRGTSSSGRKLAEAAADVVSGAQAGLIRSRINVIVDGSPFNLSDRNDDSLGGDGSVVEALRQNESFYREKIRDHFAFIRGLMVSVTVKLNTASSITTTHTVDPKKFVQIANHNEEQSTESTAQTASATGEPGAVPNVGESISGNGTGGGNSNTSDSKTDYVTDNTKEDQVVKQGPGEATVVAASVRVPRSYFVTACKTRNNGKDPDDTALTAFTEEELTQIRKEVKACTGIAADEAVVVGSYSDSLPGDGSAAGGTLAAASGPSISSLVTGHVKEIGVGVLAVLSLFMMSMMVRKGGAPVPASANLALAVDQGEPQTLQSGDSVIGQVGEGNSSLDAVELDEETVKAQQVVDQVQQLVESNPDAAANLVKRWLNRT